MRFAYADPPYLGCARLYAAHHADALAWDDPATHRQLLVRLRDEYPDGWALSLSSVSAEEMLIMCREVFGPNKVRLGSWVKPFAVFKPNVPVAYAWEPVIFRGGRRRDRTQATVRDWHSENITLKKGLPGAKPPRFAMWIADLLGVDWQLDTIDDLFPGTHGMSLIWQERSQPTQALLENG